jgi:phosphoadenosine phosphosulfate reductase
LPVHNEKFNLIKLAPLLDISKSALETYIETHKIPINPLHKKGYASIGCQPCTRPIVDGEHERDGRWWWENTKKECGLHLGK